MEADGVEMALKRNPRQPKRTKRPAPARERLLDAALALFYEQGIHGVGIDAIIARAGVAKMSLYNHFASKDELVIAFLHRMFDEWFPWFSSGAEERIANGTSPIDALFEQLRAWMQRDDFRGCPFVNSACQVYGAGNPVRVVCDAQIERLRAWIETIARRQHIADPPSASRQLLLLVEGAIVRATMSGNASHADDAAAMARTLFRS